MTQTSTATISPASPKSIAYLAALTNVAQDDNYAEWALAAEEMGQAAVSAAIKQALAHKPIAPAAPKVSKGEWHCFEGNFYLVARSQSTGKLYAKQRLAVGGFKFATGTIFKLSSATLVNASHVEEIREFAKLSDRCVFCYLPLDVPESRVAGYGKVCADNKGLPWG